MINTTDAIKYGVNWKEFEKFSRAVCSCRCGTDFRAHDKIVLFENEFVHVFEMACPGCGTEENVWKVTHNEEKWTLTDKDVGTSETIF